MKLDAKTIYAQSSDIKSRPYLEYRKDMKRKAIAELEVLPWLQYIVRQEYNNETIEVRKSGGDKSLWFLRKGGITREPDYIVEGLDEIDKIELQYGGGDIQADYVFDFKRSKVAKKVRGQNRRIPHQNLYFIYLFKGAPALFALVSANWIFENAYEGISAAWGNRPVYKITGEQLLTQTQRDDSLNQVWENINIKLDILDFQHNLIDTNKAKLSHLLQGVIDENKMVKIIPKDLDSLFKVCFILDNINKIPENANLWLTYLLTYIDEDKTLEDMSKVLYCVDFLYSKIELKPNELNNLIAHIKELMSIIQGYEQEDGSYKSSLKASPIDEIRYALFSINLMEDLIQDIIFYYPVEELTPIKKIYENVGNIEKTYELIKREITI